MKYYFITIVLMLASTVSLSGMNNLCGDSDKKIVDIDKTKVNDPSEIERSIDFSTIEAYVYPGQGLVEVLLCNIGDATVRLVNSNYQVVWSDYVETDTPALLFIDTYSNSGTFYLVISSPLWYAEGVIRF